VIAVQATTSTADARGSVTLSRAQLRINQRISQGAVRRVTAAEKDIAALGAAAPLYAVSNGAVGSNLVRGRGAVSSQRVGEGDYRVRFSRAINACAWSATLANDAPPVPPADVVKLALDTTDVARTQLVVRTVTAAGAGVNSGFHVEVFC
jgi:hypothetical protein